MEVFDSQYSTTIRIFMNAKDSLVKCVNLRCAVFFFKRCLPQLKLRTSSTKWNYTTNLVSKCQRTTRQIHCTRFCYLITARRYSKMAYTVGVTQVPSGHSCRIKTSTCIDARTRSTPGITNIGTQYPQEFWKSEICRPLLQVFVQSCRPEMVGKFRNSENGALAIIEEKFACRELQKFADQTRSAICYTF